MADEQIRAIVREVLAEVLAPLLGQHQEPKTDDWRDISDAWDVLGYSSYHALYGAIKGGVFRAGKELHDRRKPGAKQAQWQIGMIQGGSQL